MKWVVSPGLYLGCRKWMVGAQAKRLEKTAELGIASSKANTAMKDAKRSGATPAELRPLKTALKKAIDAYAKARKEIIAKGVYVLETGTGGGAMIVRHDSGAKIHSTFEDLASAQKAAEAL